MPDALTAQPRPVSDHWKDAAACRGMPVSLFVGDSPLASYTAAKRVCAGCSVREPCLSLALEHKDTVGVFGGLDERERRRLRQRRVA